MPKVPQKVKILRNKTKSLFPNLFVYIFYHTMGHEKCCRHRPLHFSRSTSKFQHFSSHPSRMIFWLLSRHANLFFWIKPCKPCKRVHKFIFDFKWFCRISPILQNPCQSSQVGFLNLYSQELKLTLVMLKMKKGLPTRQLVISQYHKDRK